MPDIPSFLLADLIQHTAKARSPADLLAPMATQHPFMMDEVDLAHFCRYNNINSNVILSPNGTKVAVQKPASAMSFRQAPVDTNPHLDARLMSPYKIKPAVAEMNESV